MESDVYECLFVCVCCQINRGASLISLSPLPLLLLLLLQLQLGLVLLKVVTSDDEELTSLLTVTVS